MAIVSFLSNIASLQAQRRLSEVTETLSTTAERLASGQRINRASDDAAGLAVADSLRVQSRLFTGAVKNLNDGISLINVIDGALANQSNILTRLSELAEQSANGVFTAAQRTTMNNEYKALLSEFGRLAESTTFNGLRPLLSRRSIGLESLLIQAGIDGSANSLLRIAGADTGRLSGVLTASMIRNSDGEIGLSDFGKLTEIVQGAKPWEVFSNCYLTTVTDHDGNTFEAAIVAADYSEDGTFGSIYSGGDPTVTFHLFFKDPNSDTWGLANSMTDVVGADTSFNVQFDSETGRALNPSVTVTGKTGYGGSFSIGLDLSALEFRVTGDPGSAIDFTSIRSTNSSLAALDVTRTRLSSISGVRGNLGAILSRLKTASNLALMNRETALSAESRIRDVDVASETAKYAASQILQNVASAVLAQANQQPKILLDLLHNAGLRR